MSNLLLCQDLQRRLVAGLVAYVAMLQQGSVRVKLRDGKGQLGHNFRCKIHKNTV